MKARPALDRRAWCVCTGAMLGSALGARASETLRGVPALGSPLTLPDLALLEGGFIRAADGHGQVVVLYWWASWRSFCAQVSPSIQKLWRAPCEHGLMVPGLSIDKDAATGKAYRARRGYGFPSGWVSPEVVRQLPKPQGLPVTLVRGRDGKVVAAEAGQLLPEDVEQRARFL